MTRETNKGKYRVIIGICQVDDKGNYRCGRDVEPHHFFKRSKEAEKYVVARGNVVASWGNRRLWFYNISVWKCGRYQQVKDVEVTKIR